MSPKQSNQPNQFEFTGDATVTYSTTSFAGKPQFSYRDSHFNENFTGDQIRTQSSELGSEVTVSLVRTVDAGNTTLTLLVPTINMHGQQQQHFETIAILSRHQSGLLPSKQAAGQTYQALKLHGVAKIVEF